MQLADVRPRLDDDRIVRFGLIALSTDLTSERDATRMLPRDRSVLHVTRVAFENPTTPENLRLMAPRLAASAALLPGGYLDSIWYSCTAASVAIGDEEVRAAIHRGCPGPPVVTPPAAACAALAALGARRISLLTPYLAETTAPVAEYFAARGFDPVRTRCLGIEDDRDIARVSAETILEAAAEADAPEADALFISCTALPALPQVKNIEARLGKPVVTSNQASFWRLLMLADLPLPRGFGRLMTTPAAEGVA